MSERGFAAGEFVFLVITRKDFPIVYFRINLKKMLITNLSNICQIFFFLLFVFSTLILARQMVFQ